MSCRQRCSKAHTANESPKTKFWPQMPQLLQCTPHTHTPSTTRTRRRVHFNGLPYLFHFSGAVRRGIIAFKWVFPLKMWACRERARARQAESLCVLVTLCFGDGCKGCSGEASNTEPNGSKTPMRIVIWNKTGQIPDAIIIKTYARKLISSS